MATFQQVNGVSVSNDENIEYEYCVFTDIFGTDTYIFHGADKNYEYEIVIDDEINKYYPENEAMIYKAIANAYQGIVTYAKMAITDDCNWLCQVYTEEELIHLIDSVEIQRLKNVFQVSLEDHIARLQVRKNLQKQLDNMNNRKDIKITITIGAWSETRIASHKELEQYADKIKQEYDNCSVKFPVAPFLKK